MVNGLLFQLNTSLELYLYIVAEFSELWNYEDNQDPVCVKSRTGYILTLGGCTITWSSELQTEISLSTTKAEYIALSQATGELVPMHRLLLVILMVMKLGGDKSIVIKSAVFEDNNGALTTDNTLKITPSTKHIGVKYHFFKHNCG